MCRSIGGMENLMEYAISIIIGYLLGSISPAALISKIKKINLRKTGTKNLGATNTTLVLGKKFGAIVMIFDIAKGAASVLIAKLLFREIAMLAGLLAGSAAVAGSTMAVCGNCSGDTAKNRSNVSWSFNSCFA